MCTCYVACVFAYSKGICTLVVERFEFEVYLQGQIDSKVKTGFCGIIFIICLSEESDINGRSGKTSHQKYCRLAAPFAIVMELNAVI